MATTTKTKTAKKSESTGAKAANAAAQVLKDPKASKDARTAAAAALTPSRSSQAFSTIVFKSAAAMSGLAPSVALRCGAGPRAKSTPAAAGQLTMSVAS